MSNSKNNSSIVMRTDANHPDWVAVRRKRRRPFGLISVVLFIISIALTAYPLIVNIFDYVVYKDQIEILNELPETYTDSEMDAKLDHAYEYNERLAGGYGITEEEYINSLNFNDNGVMAAIDIPSVSLFLPIAHSNMPQGEAFSFSTYSGLVHMGPVGDATGSSLPVGGPSTHSILLGTKESASSRLLMNIADMKVGDRMTVYAAGRANEFVVYDMRSIRGDKLPDSEIQQGNALLTIVSDYDDEGSRTVVQAKYNKNDNVKGMYPRITETALIPALKVIFGGFTLVQWCLFAVGGGLFLFFILRFALFLTDLAPREIGRLKADSG